MQFGRFGGHLHYIFALMGCQRGVTRHPDNPPSDAYDLFHYLFFRIAPHPSEFQYKQSV